MPSQAPESSLDALEAPARAWTQRLIDRDVPARLARRDASLWAADATTRELVSRRLGWVGQAGAQANVNVARGKVLLLGMGGSSLGAEAVARAFDSDRLEIVDSTVPAAVRAAAVLLPEVTDIVVASKSGATLETAALADYFEVAAQPGTRFHAVTDPGSSLVERARKKGYAELHLNAADIGGRFSVLSQFGAVPLTLAGIDMDSLYAQAARAVDRCAAESEDNRGLWLGAVLAAAVEVGRDKMFLAASPGLLGLADWIEQLVAESTGKEGKGIVPVVSPPGATLRPGDDGFVVDLVWSGESSDAGIESAGEIPVVRCSVDRPAGVGAEFYTWQVATAVVGHALGINPFDEPNVAAAKQRTREVLKNGEALVSDPESTWQVIGEAPDALGRVANAAPGTYVGILAFMAPTPATAALLERVRAAFGGKVPVTLGWGPRYLHSSGQLHKGGPAGAHFLMITASQEDLAVPGSPWTFDTIAQAQALGDVAALREAGRDVVHVHVGEGLEAGLAEVVNYLEQRIPQKTR